METAANFSIYPEHRWPTKTEQLAKVRAIAVIDPKGFNREPSLPLPVHGERGWELAKYEWRADGTGRFLYVRNTGERREVICTQKTWCV